jgi:hypothetical protein
MVVETTKGRMMVRLYHILSHGRVAFSKNCRRLDTSPSSGSQNFTADIFTVTS